ncbi:atos homolog protein B isoform X1 [Phyllobates terribilis]|uniref:atos homolog protein B isoform X1 n=1 Tax=Phyllobates terribilis TaxID=111132 RepID=UPI003CCAE3DB
MCQVGVSAAIEEGSSCQRQHKDTQGCRAAWNHRGLSNPLEKSSSLAPSIHRRLHWRLPISIVYPTLRRLHCAGPMRHIQMDPPPKQEENGGENSRSTSVDVTSPGQTGVLNASQDCRVLVEYPENEHKLQKVYHVSITSDSPGPKAICRQALKRGPPEQIPEPPRSPRRAFWGHAKSECPPGNYQSDGDYLSCPLADDDDDDTFEDGLLTEDIPTCSSAQHFSHSGLRVVEHRAEGFYSQEPKDRRLTMQSYPKIACRKTYSPSPSPCTNLHKRSPKETQLEDSQGLSTASETNGSNVSFDPRTSEESTSNQHILDNVLHNTAHPETLTENLEAVSLGGSHSSANGNSVVGLSSLDTSKETSLLCMQDQKPQTADGEDPGSLERTPPGLARLCSPASGSTAVKRKLLPSTEIEDSCSEDEGHGKRWRGGESCQTLHGSCRSTDSKAAPFWNHLLPTARNSPKSPTDCTSRRTKRELRLKSRTLRNLRKGQAGRSCTGNWAKPCVSRSLLGNFEESILRGRFAPSGQIEGFTAEIGASGSYCPQHVTLPVEVTYFHISEHSAPSPFLGVIDLDGVGRKGYSVPSTGTIQVTLFNPNKTVVKMFLVTYDFKDMPVNHVTFLRHRIFLVPVQENDGESEGPHCASGGAAAKEKAKRILCYLMHLRFQRSKSGKIYLNEDIRLLFSRKSIEMDTGIPYELKSFTEAPKNPKYSPRV